jgi:nitrite reductase/ring-hydroxylating ferredoxin subunit
VSERIEVCPVDELPSGEKTIVEVEELPHSIGVFNVDGEFYALANVCPHQLAPLCEGTVKGYTTAPKVGEYEVTREGEIIRCPWHGWHFDIRTGESVFNPHEVATRIYEVAVESTPTDADENEDDDAEASQAERYGTALADDEPPIDTYPVEVERDIVVVYV